MLEQKQQISNYMTKKYALFSIIGIFLLIIVACTNDNDDEYTPVSPVVVDLTTVPYEKLS